MGITLILINFLIILFFSHFFKCSDLENTKTFETKNYYQLTKINANHLNKYSLRNLDHLITLKGNSTPIFGNSSAINYYFADLYIGDPPQKQSLIIDTGSHLTAVPCLPHCERCGNHLNKYYDMRLSSKSKIVNCKEDICKNSWSGSCGTDDQCSFFIVRIKFNNLNAINLHKFLKI